MISHHLPGIRAELIARALFLWNAIVLKHSVPLFTITVTKTLIHHRATESTERRLFAHSREIRRRPFGKLRAMAGQVPRMGKLLVRLRRRLVHLFSQSISSTVEFQFWRVFIQNPLHKPGTHLSFAGISRQMKDLAFSVSSVPGLL